MLKRYHILRTVFIHEGPDLDRPMQIVLAERNVEFHFEDIHPETEEEKDRIIRAFREKDRKRSFDLSKDVLMRVAVFRLDDSRYEFIWSHHHILIDGWCLGILISEFFEIYRSFLDRREYQLPAVKPYRAYIEWLEAQDREKSREFWEKYLANYEEASHIGALGRGKTGAAGYRVERAASVLDEINTRRLNQLAASNQVTLNNVARSCSYLLPY